VTGFRVGHGLFLFVVNRGCDEPHAIARGPKAARDGVNEPRREPIGPMRETIRANVRTRTRREDGDSIEAVHEGSTAEATAMRTVCQLA